MISIDEDEFFEMGTKKEKRNNNMSRRAFEEMRRVRKLQLRNAKLERKLFVVISQRNDAVRAMTKPKLSLWGRVINALKSVQEF